MQRFHRTFATAIATTALFAATAFSVSAQTPTSATNSGSTPCAQTPCKGKMDFAQRHAQHLEQMKTILQLQPNQQAAWDKFAKAMTPTQRIKPTEQRQDLRQLTTPERLDIAQKLRQERNAKAEQREAAVREFYASLTPSQQKAFDTLHKQHHSNKGMHKKGFGHHMKGGDEHQGKGPKHMPAPVASPAA